MTTQNKQKKTTPTPEQKEASIKRVAEKIDKDIKETYTKIMNNFMQETAKKYIKIEASFFKDFLKCDTEKIENIKIPKKIQTKLSSKYIEYFKTTKSSIEYKESDNKIKNINKITTDKKKYQLIYAFLLNTVLGDLLHELKNSTSTKDELEEYTEIEKIIEKVRPFFIYKYIEYNINKINDKQEDINILQLQTGKFENAKFTPSNKYLIEDSSYCLVLESEENAISKYLEYTDKFAKNMKNATLYYRGQSNAIWEMTSSLLRENKFAKNERKMFHELIALKPDAFENNKTTYEKMITMQHYFLPTRLLDITTNPLIALFFACDHPTNINDGKVFIINLKKKIDNKNIKEYYYYSKEIEQLDKLVYDGEIIETDELINNICYLHGYANNPRIINQCGSFIFVGKEEEDNTTLNKLPSNEIIIPSSLKKAILKQLETLNIHAGTIYPDLPNIIEYIKYKYTTKND